MTMLSLGISPKTTRGGFNIKNGSATLFDGEQIVVSIPEERLTRTKSDSGCATSVRFILEDVLNGDLPDVVATSTCCEAADQAGIEHLNDALLLESRLQRVESHHLSHALCAYYLSPYARAVVCVIDAGGNTFSRVKDGRWWEMPREQMSLFLAEGKSLKLLARCFDASNEWGIGESYRAFTKFLGLGGQTSSGKLMGLSAYGEKLNTTAPLFVLRDEGLLGSNLQMPTPWKAEASAEQMLSKAGLVIPPRLSTEPLQLVHADVARFIQEETEKAVLHSLRWALKKTGANAVCIAGGVGLNCPINTRVLEEKIAASVFVPPCPGDDGQSVGNALYPFHVRASERFSVRFENAFLGPDYGDEAEAMLEAALDSSLELIAEDAHFSTTADLLTKGQIVGWFQGRSEIGPRALGHRSILADPRRRESRVRLSSLIKGRDAFRPYAASVLQDQSDEWFELPCPNPFMLFLGRLREHTKKVAPTLFHPDGSCRVQTVAPTSPELYALLTSFKKRTGLPFVLNTSYNTAGMPIVEVPSEALQVLRSTDLDAAVIGRHLVCKRRATRAPEFTKPERMSFDFDDADAERKISLFYPGVPIARRQYFGLVREYCDWILLGRKCTTVRYSYGAIDLPTTKDMEIVARPGGEVVYGVQIKRITIVPFSDLTHQDAVRDGFRSVMELRDALTRFYSGITDQHPVTIYDVEVMSGFEMFRGRTVCDS
jgi:carbamoyltransferase